METMKCGHSESDPTCSEILTEYNLIPEALKSLYRSPGNKTRGSGEPVSLT